MSDRPDHVLEGRIKAFKTSGNSLVIEGFANAATVDRAKDLIDPEAFTKTNGLNNFMKNPTILFDHGLDPNVGGLPIGKATEVTATKQGLFIKAKISQAKDPPISTIRTLIEEGNLRAFSVGFNPEEVEPDSKGVNVIKSAELFEVSVVGLPMNQDSLFQMASKDGKKLMRKSISQIKADIASEKGYPLAVKANLALDELAEDDNARKSLIDSIARLANVSEFSVYDYLNGDIESTPIKRAATQVLAASKQFGDDDKDDEEEDEKGGDKKPKEDEEKSSKKTVVTGKGSGAADHTHKAVFDNETGAGETTSTDGDGPDHKHAIKDFKIEAGGEDKHTHPALKGFDKDDDDNKEDEDKEKDAGGDKKDFQECVNEKIPKLIEEGKDQDEAVAIAIDFCRDRNKCIIKPDREMYAEFFKTADTAKQAIQEGEDGVTGPIDTSPPEEPSTPALDQQKQTNVLLGSLTNEFKLLRDSLSGMTEELSAAIRQLVSTLGAGKSQVDELPDDAAAAEGLDEVEKRMAKTKAHLTKLDKRLKELGV